MGIILKNIGEFNIGDNKRTVNKILLGKVTDDKTITISKNSTVLKDRDSLDNIIDIQYKDNKVVSITASDNLVENIPDELINAEIIPYCIKFGNIKFSEITPDKCTTTDIDFCKECSNLFTYFKRIEIDSKIMIYKLKENLYAKTISLVDSNIDSYDDETYDAVHDTIFG